MSSERWARVEAGVVKDQLNAALAAHGLFFPPELSTSNRATIGGMISTDACGQGSCLYGKTRDHVLELTTVLLGRHGLALEPARGGGTGRSCKRRPDRVGAIHRLVDAIAARQRRADRRALPQAQPLPDRLRPRPYPRQRTGASTSTPSCAARRARSGLLAEAKLNVLPIPTHGALVNVRYASFDAALRDAQALIRFGAASIETVDSKVLAPRPRGPDLGGRPRLLPRRRRRSARPGSTWSSSSAIPRRRSRRRCAA